MFGQNSNNQSSPFASFGSNTNTQNTTNSVFGGGSTAFGANKNSGSMFGQSSNTPSSGGLFGQSSSNPNTSTSGGMFGSSNTNQNTSGGFGGFGSTTTAAASSPFGGQSSGTNLFGSNKPASTGFGGFGSSNTTSSPFGASTGSAGGGFGSASSNQNQGTAVVPFEPLQEKDSTKPGAFNSFQSITAMPQYRNFSFEVCVHTRIIFWFCYFFIVF